MTDISEDYLINLIRVGINYNEMITISLNWSKWAILGCIDDNGVLYLYYPVEKL
jgi:hypothetical protein